MDGSVCSLQMVWEHFTTPLLRKKGGQAKRLKDGVDVLIAEAHDAQSIAQPLEELHISRLVAPAASCSDGCGSKNQ